MNPIQLWGQEHRSSSWSWFLLPGQEGIKTIIFSSGQGQGQRREQLPAKDTDEIRLL